MTYILQVISIIYLYNQLVIMKLLNGKLMMQQKPVSIILGVIIYSLLITPASAREQYLIATGAHSCTTCHIDEYGGPGWKPGVLDDFYQNGIQGLIDYVKAATIDTAPVLSQINSQWDITVGEAPLVISLQVFDQENDSFLLHGKGKLPITGYTLSPLYTDSATNLPTYDLKWSPTAQQANKSYKIKIYAQENGDDRLLTSNTVTANITVWPARANAVTAKVKEFKLLTARWLVNKLVLSGQVIFKPTVTTAQRNAALSSLTMQLRSNSDFVFGSPLTLKLNSNGDWTSIIPLTNTQVPCLVKAEYEGLNASRIVKLAPANCVQ